MERGLHPLSSGSPNDAGWRRLHPGYTEVTTCGEKRWQATK
jgi:hypothetical protein